MKAALSLAVLRNLRARGWDVLVAVCYPGSGGYEPDPAEDFRARNCLFDLSVSPDSARDVLERLVDERRIDIVLQIGAGALYVHLPYLKERYRGLHIIDCLYNPIGHTLRHYIYDACFDGIVVESRMMMDFMILMSSSTRRIDVIPNGVDLDHFVPSSTRPQLDRLAVGFIGRMAPEKNPLGFIDLARALADVFPKMTFPMFGDGALSTDVQRRAVAFRPRGRLEYHGYVHDSRMALHELDLLIVPSTLDGRPNIIMEASACGVPVIASPVGAIPELIEEGRNGFLLPPTESASIIDVVRTWIADKDAAATLCRSSRLLAEERFGSTSMFDEYDRVFRGYLGRLG